MRRTNTSIVLFILIFFLLKGCQNPAESAQDPVNLEIKDGAYYINGEKTFINAIGYEIGARPGQHPYEDIKELEISRMKNDLQVIKRGGFNAIRTWKELTEEEVKLVQQSGLMLVYGIWIDPTGEFGDPRFIAEAEEQVKKVMRWAVNYDCIITYLIMNEPMAETIFEKGAQNTYNLWTGLTKIIHEEHPGIPVTISNNSAIGEYINERIFDVYGYNTYNYNEGMPGYTQGFPNHFAYLKKLNGENKPLLVTEFGLSVSPISGGGMYGGNSRKEQASHVVSNFSDILDAGVAGICPFYYADGWWKAGDPDQHDPWPEEWFGFWGYADETDTTGYPRPVWYEFSEYNQAIIGSPRNHEIYGINVPIEFYINKDVKNARIIYNDRIIFDKEMDQGYYSDEIQFDEEEITDRELIFEFYDGQGYMKKWESIMILTSKDEIPLPVIKLELNSDDLEKNSHIKARFTIMNDSIFSLDNEFKYAFVHHQGWNPGEHRMKEIKTDLPIYSFTDTYRANEESLVLNIGGGVDIKFGKFVKRIHTEKMIYRGDWADPIKVD